MLVSLHVKNFAIIDEVWVDFTNGMNVLTGETGAGKSILLGSIHVALGGKVSKELLGKNGDYALAELMFEGLDERVREVLERHELPIEETLVISRRIMESGRSISKINGEAVNASILREVSSCLMDIHGQHEHQTLLSAARQLELVDRFSGDEGKALLAKVKDEYRTYHALWQELSEALTHSESRQRELSLLQYEYDEIEQAKLKPGEDVTLEERYQVLVNQDRIKEATGLVEERLRSGNDNVSESLSRSLRQLGKVISYDESLQTIYDALRLLEEQVTDITYQLVEYQDSLGEEDGELEYTEERLNLINRLKAKYGNSIEKISAYAKEQEEKLERLQNYDEYIASLERRTETAKAALLVSCEKLSAMRRAAAERLAMQIREALTELNFLNVVFEIPVTELEKPTEKGMDELEFLISTNPGEPLRPLAKVASGGELSRVMLALKSVFAGRDEIDTLIFDEIDVGVSGRTAQRVAEKMARIAMEHQVICITHLPQIAAMAETHFRIEKYAIDGSTKTEITRLPDEEIVNELARILGGAQITESVLENAREMKQLAMQRKAELAASV